MENSLKKQYDQKYDLRNKDFSLSFMASKLTAKEKFRLWIKTLSSNNNFIYDRCL